MPYTLNIIKEALCGKKQADAVKEEIYYENKQYYFYNPRYVCNGGFLYFSIVKIMIFFKFQYQFDIIKVKKY